MKEKKATRESNVTQLAESQRYAIDLLAQTHDAMVCLSQVRAEHKLSNVIVSGVAREIGELMKVMSMYEK